MSLPDVIETFKNGLMHVCLWVLAALAICTLLLLASKRKQVRPVFAHIPSGQCVVLLVVMAVCTLFSGKNTNSPPAGIMAPFLPPLSQSVVQMVTEDEIAQGYRLESVTTNDAISYSMPTNGVVYAPWTLRGGYETHFPLDLGDFAFPFGTGVVHRLDVLSGGMVESFPRPSCMSICAAREWASIVPGTGRFWWADAAGTRDACPYRVKVLTWENVYAGRDCTGQYNAQIELRDDGSFTTRSNNVESAYRRVLPCDLDYDGLPDAIDPDPETPLVPPAWNQAEAWAAAAFPSNAADIASAGGYAAWAAAHGADPDRRLVSLGVAFDDGSAWPALLGFGGVPAMADGREELAFAIDCGAKVPFSLTSGRLGSITVTATEPPMRSGEGLSTTESSEIQGISAYPHERMVGDVKLHLDGPCSGWLCRFAGVSIDPDSLSHIYPCGSVELEATLSCCHSNAYLGCSWYGGTGITFSQEHSLSTEATYDPSDPEDWTTNVISLVTQFVGYTLTNHLHVTVGTTNEPPLRFSLGCQNVFFLNDADFLDGACMSNRPERIRPVTLNLTGPVGTNGTVTLSVEGGANPVVFHVVDGATNLVTASTEIPLAVTNDVSYTGSYTIYVSCPNLGTGTITATFTPSGDNIEPLTASATFRCVEPLRKLVTTDKVGGRYVNPSRLVMGTNAVLKVSANGPFSSSEVDWRLVSGSADVVPNGWSATVTPTGLDTVVVEARFNDDEIQPRFVLPVVQPRTIPVRVFVVQPPENIGQDVAEETDNMNVAWTNQEICRMFDTANEIFTQVGIHFELIEGPVNIGRTKDWTIFICDTVTNSAGEVSYSDDVSTQMVSLLNHYRTNDCVEVYFTGHLLEPSVDAITCPLGMIISKNHTAHTLAHELGHTLGLKDIFHRLKVNDDGQIVTVNLGIRQHTIDKTIFADDGHDWCLETGIGFYERNDTIASVIDKLLMCGIEDSDVDAVSYGDIPYGKVYGLSKYLEKGFQKVGVSEIEPSNGKVYSR